MNFILPEFFDSLEEDLKAIFKAKGGSQALLARERITRAKQMLTPFVLRRRKDQVLFYFRRR
jgi:SWI/SNF-related matrix-associated actin-dependent regulator 1 of chromatin subfamily A